MHGKFETTTIRQNITFSVFYDEIHFHERYNYAKFELGILFLQLFKLTLSSNKVNHCFNRFMYI